MNQNILVFAAHPDDETLGCGGVIAKLSERGATVHVAFLADGVSSRPGEAKRQDEELMERRAAAETACRILGVKSVSFDEFPDNRMDTVALLDIVKKLESLIWHHHPDTVFTHQGGDVNVDHRRVHEATVAACRPQRDHPVRTILSYEVPSSTEWQFPGLVSRVAPTWYSDISDTLNKKLDALKVYAMEMREWPHPRSVKGVEHLARWRGATVGVNAAEAFILERRIS